MNEAACGRKSAAGAIDGFARRCRGVAADCGYYFYQYMLRSAPAVMMPELTAGFGLTAAGVASLLGLFYYGYAPFSLVAGVAMDQIGPRKVVPAGAATVAVGAILFATGDPTLGAIGRFLQGAGGVFALIGAVAIATSSLPASRAATLIGVTQMFGMAGGSAGRVRRRPGFGGGPALEDVLDRNGCDRFSNCRRSPVPYSQTVEERRSSGLGSSDTRDRSGVR